MNLLKKSIASIIMIAALGTTSALYDLTRPHKAEAQILNSTILDAQRWVEFWQVEAQEITTDQIRKIVIKQVTKKVIDKIVGGESGGVSGS
ncbi:MAG: hypothetical protein Q8P33_03610, partial [bacterium]|nr:hypothetical protein [bacterium]